MKTDRQSLFLSIGLHLVLVILASRLLPKEPRKSSLEDAKAGLVWVSLERTERQWAKMPTPRKVIGPGTAPKALPVPSSAEQLVPYGKNPKGEYPAEALRNSWQGVVWLEFDVDVEGNVTDVRITKSSGHQVLDQEAAQNQRHWKYSPGSTGTYTKPYVFRLVGTI